MKFFCFEYAHVQTILVTLGGKKQLCVTSLQVWEDGVAFLCLAFAHLLIARSLQWGLLGQSVHVGILCIEGEKQEREKEKILVFLIILYSEKLKTVAWDTLPGHVLINSSLLFHLPNQDFQFCWHWKHRCFLVSAGQSYLCWAPLRPISRVTNLKHGKSSCWAWRQSIGQTDFSNWRGLHRFFTEYYIKKKKRFEVYFIMVHKCRAERNFSNGFSLCQLVFTSLFVKGIYYDCR